MCRLLTKIFVILIFCAFEAAFAQCADECANTQGISNAKTFVSVSPAMTEIMYAIGAEDLLVAVSNYCTYPKDAKKKEKIGSNYSINEEKILKLKPDYILALDISEALLNKFKRLGIKPLCFKYPDIESIYENILTIGNLTGREKKAKEIVEFSKRKIEAVQSAQSAARNNSQKGVQNGRYLGKKVLYIVQTKPMITIGKKSFITDVIEKSGNYSATADLNSFYPVILEEYAIKLKPDVVVLGAFTNEKDAKRFFPNTRIVKMNEEQNDIINRPGPRVYKSVEFFAAL